jgi:hypothetical protein
MVVHTMRSYQMGVVHIGHVRVLRLRSALAQGYPIGRSPSLPPWLMRGRHAKWSPQLTSWKSGPSKMRKGELAGAFGVPRV